MKGIAAVLVLFLVPGLAVSDVPTENGLIECYCTDTYGQRVELGESVCLFVDGRSFIAKCEMSLNNPAWRDTGVDCTMSRRSVPPEELEAG